MRVGGSESSSSDTSSCMDTRYSVSEMSVFCQRHCGIWYRNEQEDDGPVISSGKMESRTSRSSVCSSLPMAYLCDVILVLLWWLARRCSACELRTGHEFAIDVGFECLCLRFFGAARVAEKGHFAFFLFIHINS